MKYSILFFFLNLCCISLSAQSISGSVDGHNYVDLSLPSGILWATCNIGASSPEENGEYFAWGETNSKEMYDWSNYKYSDGGCSLMEKYGLRDQNAELTTDDDAAYVKWGHKWRIPSNREIEELLDPSYTTTSWIIQNDVAGLLVTSNKNNNSVFFPTSGYKRKSAILNSGKEGYYWSRNRDFHDNGYSYVLFFVSRLVNTGSRICCEGLPIRPILYYKLD